MVERQQQSIKADYSEYLKQPGMLNYIESEWIAKPGEHDIQASIVDVVAYRYGCKSVVDIGCGTGEVAKRLSVENYEGIDLNVDCIKMAMEKRIDYKFSVGDVREIKRFPDLVVCFGFLKHFGLHEWVSVFNRIAKMGEYFIFDIPIGSEIKDDGIDYHHIWMTREAISNECNGAGLKIISKHQLNKDEFIFVTKKHNY